jgi:histidinol-phosphate aminotransferase
MTQTTPHYDELAVPGVRGLHPYEPGKPLAELEREFGIRDAVKLASNENPLGPSPLALSAAREAVAGIARYPEGSGYLLAGRLAGQHGVAPNCITLGNGSNDVLDMIARVFLGPGSEAVFSQHAFHARPGCRP